MLGLPQGSVALHPYDTVWPRLFAEEAARLRAAIGPYILAIEHIGSTAIPGIEAKPILDIGIAVRDFDEARICIAPIVRLGYEFRGELGVPRRHYFTKGEPRTHHLHMNEISSEDWRKTIRFRDYLREHPDLARAYADLKLSLARQFPHDRPAYLAGKHDFIQQVLRLAAPPS